MSKLEWADSQRVLWDFDDRVEAERTLGRPHRWTTWNSWQAWARLVSMRLRWWTTGRLIVGALVALVFTGSLWVIALSASIGYAVSQAVGNPIGASFIFSRS